MYETVKTKTDRVDITAYDGAVRVSVVQDNHGFGCVTLKVHDQKMTLSSDNNNVGQMYFELMCELKNLIVRAADEVGGAD